MPIACQAFGRGIVMRNHTAVGRRKATSKLIQKEILPMATRVERLAEYTTDRQPRPGSKVELLCEDHRGTYVLPFPCHRAEGHGSTPTAMRKFKLKLSAGEHGIPAGAAEKALQRRARRCRNATAVWNLDQLPRSVSTSRRRGIHSPVFLRGNSAVFAQGFQSTRLPPAARGLPAFLLICSRFVTGDLPWQQF